MQGPLGIPTTKDAIAFGRGAATAGGEMLPYVPDVLSMMIPARGLGMLMRGILLRRKGRATFEAGRAVYNMGQAKKAEALMLREAYRAGAPVKGAEITALVEAANKHFRRAKKMRSAALQQGHKAQRKIRSGSRKLGGLGQVSKAVSAASEADSGVASQVGAGRQDFTNVQRLRSFRGRR